VPIKKNVETTGRRAVIAFTIRVLLSAVVMAAATTLFSLFVWTVLPFAVGWSPSVIVTGSMEPSIAPGDIVVTAPIKPEQLKLGYVIRFRDPSNAHPYLMHRIIEIKDDGNLVTKGDANQSADSTPVPPSHVTGVARLRVPVIGLPAVWMRNGQFLQLGAVLVAVAFAARMLTGLRALVASAPGAADDDDADQPETGPQLQDPELPDLEPGVPTDTTEPGTAPVTAPASPSDPVTAVALPIAPPLAVTPPEAVSPVASPVALPVASPGASPVAGPVISPAAARAEPAVEPAAEQVVGGRAAVGRHRGEGRASWRRDRNGERPRSRRQDRTSRDGRVDSAVR
jgi:signal peptidase